MMLPVAWALLGAGVAGLVDSLYFTLVTYGLMAPDARFIPRVCRMDRGSCTTILRSRWARLFGLPNSVFGVAWSAVVIAAAAAGVTTGDVPFCRLLLAAASVTVAVSVLLAWALLARLRAACPLCFVAHGVNVAVLVLLAVECRAP